MITLFLQGQKLTLAQTTIVADAINYLTARLIYKTAEWAAEGLTVIAHFKKGETQLDIEVQDGEIGPEAELNLTKGVWSVWVTGHEYEEETLAQRITSSVATLTVEDSGIVDGEPMPMASYGEVILGEVRDIYSDVTGQLNAQNTSFTNQLSAQDTAVTNQLAAQDNAVDQRLDANEAAVTAMLGKVKNERNDSFIKLWAGSSAQYTAATKAADTIYLIDLLGGET